MVFLNVLNINVKVKTYMHCSLGGSNDWKHNLNMTRKRLSNNYSDMRMNIASNLPAQPTVVVILFHLFQCPALRELQKCKNFTTLWNNCDTYKYKKNHNIIYKYSDFLQIWKWQRHNGCRVQMKAMWF